MKYLLIITLLFLLSCQQEGKPVLDVEAQECSTKIDELIKRYSELARFSGAVLVESKDKIIFSETVGYANHENSIGFTDKSSFRIGGLSIYFLKAILDEQIKRNSLKPNLKIGQYLEHVDPKLSLENLVDDPSYFGTDSTCIENSLLLKLSDSSYLESIAALAKELSLTNTHFNENNAHTVTGHVNASQDDMLVFTTTPSNHPDYAGICNGMYSTPNDLLRVLNHLKIDSLKIRDYLQHDGFNYSVDRESGSTIIILANSRHPVGGEISNSIRAIMNKEEYVIPLARKQIEVSKSILKKYTGKYELAENQYIDINMEQDSLFVFLGPQKMHLLAQSENQFFMSSNF